MASFAAVVLIVGAGLVGYYNSLTVPLIFDDSSAITHNPSIRSLWPIADVLFPPAECTVAGRPLANLSFALNFALGAENVGGYHVLNLIIHTFSALCLFGIVRRTLISLSGTGVARPDTGSVLGRYSLGLGLAAGILWVVHPLLTESVTYISQRTEALMALFYLLMLYGFIRAVGSGGGWWIASIAACFAGVASKEGMVTAPVLVFLYDRTFVAGSFRHAWRLHWRYYIAALSSWIVLGFLLAGLGHRSVGYGLGVTWWKYALTECEAVLLYLRLIFWPHPLIFDYGAIFADNAFRSVVAATCLAGLLGATSWALWRRPALGFLLAAFFITLAPTSSVVPVATQPIAENRVYLPSTAIIAGAVVLMHLWLGKRSLWITALAAAALTLQTIQRNKTYQSEVSLWTDNIAKRPAAPRGFENLGEAYYDAGNLNLARKYLEQAVRVEPTYAGAYHNLGTTLHALGDVEGAVRQFQEAVRLRPDFPIAHNNLGNALLTLGKVDEATLHLREALRLYEGDWRLKPDLPETHNSLGNALLLQGRLEDARGHYQEAIRLRPTFAQAHMNLGVVLRELGQGVEAKRHIHDALQLRPDFVEAHYNLAITQARLGENSAAEEELRRVLALKPDFIPAHKALAELLGLRGDLPGAQTQLQAVLSLRPDDADARAMLEQIRNSASGPGRQQP